MWQRPLSQAVYGMAQRREPSDRPLQPVLGGEMNLDSIKPQFLVDFPQVTSGRNYCKLIKINGG